MTPEQKTAVEALWKQGLAYDHIAVQVGVSRSAVAGHCYRHGLARSSHHRHRMPRRAIDKPRRAKGGVPFLAAEDHHCRVVIGKGKDGLAVYCGQPKSHPTSFCIEHRLKLMYWRPAGYATLARWMKS